MAEPPATAENPSSPAGEGAARRRMRGRPKRDAGQRPVAPAKPADPHRTLAARVAEFRDDPLGYARFAWPWRKGPFAAAPGPRAWQADVLARIGAHLANPATRHTPLRLARASGHGIGKSALIAMLVKWGLDTAIDTRILVTANTENQLLTRTAPEIAKWSRAAITHDWFRPLSGALVSTASGHDRTWRCDLVTWNLANTDAFAGLHNQGKRLILIFDEASGIPAKIWEVALGALTDAETEIVFLAFGNPTQNSGPFRECFGAARHLWDTAQIDSRTVEGTNRAYLDEIVATYGEDHDIARVRVRGQFPSASSMQFIPADHVAAARLREVHGMVADPVVFGLDCARYGGDRSVLAIRSGRDARSRPWKRWANQDAMTLAGDVALQAQLHRPDAIFVDAGNIGAAIADRLRQLGVENVHEVWFGGKGGQAVWAGDLNVRTANKRAQMWANMRAWLPGGAIPDDDALAADLTGVEYGYATDQVAILLEKKEHMKARGLASPDEADALALTFAEAVAPRWPEPAVHWTRQAPRRDEEEEWEDVYRELREE
ncbi:MAG: terminase [Sphingomonas sp.]|uniref:terminase n=1 Tax=Sphingomonas sp. TaxID=28214 RepID=UPI0035673FFE